MKIVNNWQTQLIIDSTWARDHALSLALFIITLLMLSACSETKQVIKPELLESPQTTHTNMSDSLQCVSQHLQQMKTNRAYIFLIRDIVDGTVRGSVQDGPLSDAGRIQLINVLSEHIYSHVGVVTDNFPLIFRQTLKNGIGLDEYAEPDKKKLLRFSSTFRKLINRARSNKNMSPLKLITPIIISGSFTRLDAENIYQKGSGKNAGTRSGDGNANVDFGTTASAKALSLVVNLIDPRHNIVVGSQSLSLNVHKTNKKFRLRLALGDGFFGLSKNEVIVEGLHGAQKTLIDAAALWILHKIYSDKTDFSNCLTATYQHHEQRKDKI